MPLLLAVISLSCALPAGEEPPGAALAADARRFFELGDYPAAERAIQALLEAVPPEARAERAVRLAQLAEVRVLQGLGGAAVKDAESALALDPSPAVRRSAIFVYVRTLRYGDALPHLDLLLAREPGDASLKLSRGIARARTGEPRAALEDLAAGLELPAARREARFELALAFSKLDRPGEALVRLREILEDDPYDAEACYQASRQLLRLKRPHASRLAAALVRYFESLREAEGASSRDQHLAFEGKPIEAALARASRWERMGRFDRVLDELERLGTLHPSSEEAAAWRRGFYQRLGFDPDVTSPALEVALEGKGSRAEEDRALRAARLLLAREPRSTAALKYLALRAEAPGLIVPRLHYVSRLADVEPSIARWPEKLATLRRALEGASPPR